MQEVIFTENGLAKVQCLCGKELVIAKTRPFLFMGYCSPCYRSWWIRTDETTATIFSCGYSVNTCSLHETIEYAKRIASPSFLQELHDSINYPSISDIAYKLKWAIVTALNEQEFAIIVDMIVKLSEDLVREWWANVKNKS